MDKSKVRLLLYDTAIVIIGALLFSASMNMFLLPAKIVVGGMTGIATVVNLYVNIPVGIMIILLNIPLVILNTRRFGFMFLVRTLIGTLSTSLAIDFISIFPITITDPLLCAVFGGVTMGASLGLLLSRGYTTGGTDLIACLLKVRFKRLPTGSLIMFSDLAIIVIAAIITREWSGIFYSIISLYVMGRITDLIISGSQRAELALIISSDPEGLTRLISERLGRGATLLDGSGGFTSEPRRVVMCVVGKGELFFLKQAVAGFDPNAFFVICKASEVLGEGFGSGSSMT
ncbi:MAG: YitT family protein [Clostridiales bacterium]|nr:YitT family protein [Clostridiales bacterium]